MSAACSRQDSVTLQSDGTSKHGQHYYSFQIDSTYSLGLAEMLTGSTMQVLHIFKQVLSDVELVAGPTNVYCQGSKTQCLTGT